MKVLALDTSTRTASVAVLEDDSVLAELDDDSGDHSGRLIAVIDEVLTTSGIELADLDAIAIGAGPGSFTGLRIGMATAKGLAFAADKPLWAVSSLAAVAQAAAPGPELRYIAAVADAQRREVFLGLFDAKTREMVSDERVLSPADLAATLTELGASPDSTMIVGGASKLYPEELASCGVVAPATLPRARFIAAVARAGTQSDVRATATPVYIRPSEAEIRFPDGNPGGTFAPRRGS